MAIPFTDEELIPAVKNSLEKASPKLALDGGGVTLDRIENGVVYVQLLGGCVGGSSSNNTIKYVIERQLKIDIHPEITVVDVTQVPGENR